MFTLQEIKAAHAKVKTGADFPAYIQEIKALGLVRYDFMVTDGSINYYGLNDHHVKADAIYPEKNINHEASAPALRHTITIHQQGQTDFLTFCQQAADAGVVKWVVDTQNMVCTYVDAGGKVLVAEPIPDAAY